MSEDFRRRGRPWRIFFGFYKTRHILVSDSANCIVLCAVVLTQYRRVTDRRTDRWTDRQTDGIAVASTALAKRHAVKTTDKNDKLMEELALTELRQCAKNMHHISIEIGTENSPVHISIQCDLQRNALHCKMSIYIPHNHQSF